MPRKKYEPTGIEFELHTAKGAGQLAAHIVAWWAQRGHVVKAERFELPGGGGYGVRSDMVNGKPVGAKSLDWRTAADRAAERAAAKSREAPLMTEEDRSLAARRAEFLG